MTIADASTLLLEGTALALAFALLRLSFWLHDRLGKHRHLPGDVASEQQEGAKVVPLVLATVGSGTGLTIDLASGDVQPAGEKDKAILYRPEHAQHFNNKPKIEPEQHQRA